MAVKLEVTLYTDAACTQSATAQQVIDAFSTGDVRISQTVGGVEAVMTVLSLEHLPGSGSDPITKLSVVNPNTNSIRTIRLAG